MGIRLQYFLGWLGSWWLMEHLTFWGLPAIPCNWACIFMLRCAELAKGNLGSQRSMLFQQFPICLLFSISCPPSEMSWLGICVLIMLCCITSHYIFPLPFLNSLDIWHERRIQLFSSGSPALNLGTYRTEWHPVWIAACSLPITSCNSVRMYSRWQVKEVSKNTWPRLGLSEGIPQVLAELCSPKLKASR